MMQKSTGLGDVQYFFVIYTISNAIDIFNSKKPKKWRGEHHEKSNCSPLERFVPSLLR